LKGAKFLSVDEIPVHLLESISTCYSQKIPSCRWCFLTHLPSTQQQLLSMSIFGGVCRKCLRQKTGDEIIKVICSLSNRAVTYSNKAVTSDVTAISKPYEIKRILCVTNSLTKPSIRCYFNHIQLIPMSTK